MKILVPTDGSTPSIKALEYAMYLLRLMSSSTNKSTNKTSEVILMTVLPRYQVPFEIKKNTDFENTGEVTSLSELLKKIDQVMKTEWSNRLSEIESRHVESGISIKTKLLEGGASSSRTIAEKIVQFSTDEQVDLLVIGSIGLGGISKVKSLGSVSRNLVELSKRPVLIVH